LTYLTTKRRKTRDLQRNLKAPILMFSMSQFNTIQSSNPKYRTTEGFVESIMKYVHPNALAIHLPHL
jgi:hypothetical protein